VRQSGPYTATLQPSCDATSTYLAR
jgi:hypothetical protein